ncbi:ricin-type beta-trefoil lectin domain protein [Dactylosporangium sp. CA-092794]|uniref:ricin-type beta-trefoil lectin domain protein n=1 Tax=Dactylosporangium sp. CA-092794 TaxID=3239929 RepID=UPI003D8FB9A5
MDYGQFAFAYGGDYGLRLHLVSLPDCALSTPQLPECQVQTPVDATNDEAAKTLTADRAVVGSASTSSTVFALTSGSGSSAEDWTATDLSLSYSWASGTAAGDFTLHYPVTAPDGLGGPEPQVAFRYSSGSVDAQTAAKTGQASVVGEGWQLDGAGYVERSFRACTDDGGTTPDNCWVNAGAVTLVLGGHAVKLVQDGSGVWHASSDDKLRIENLTDSTAAHNDARNGEYWKVTDLDGVQYFFGRQHRYLGDTADTKSVLREPVFGNNTGEPCNTDSASLCQQAWRWNLDYVVDPRGNSMTYFYTRFQGQYKVANVLMQPYDLSATLDRIEYGTRAGSEASATAPMKVSFDYAERCWNNCPTWPPTDPSSQGYADSPIDQFCNYDPANPGAACPSGVDITAPVHFSHVRLSAVRTQVSTGPGAYRNVDKWDLEQTFAVDPDNETKPNLWLVGLTHTGYATDGATLAEPQVRFDGEAKPNRTDYTASMAKFNHFRIKHVYNGVGGTTTVTYSGPQCINGWPKIYGDGNPSRCFPMWYKPPAAAAGWGYFNKYVVLSVTDSDATGGSPDETWSYDYATDGSSDTSLWAHDDVDIANVAHTAWADWRGYPTVTVTHGTVTGQQTVTKTIYHRGLAGDAKKSGDDTQTLYNQRSAFTIEPLQQASEIPIGLAGGGTNTTGALCLDIVNGHSEDGAALQTIGCYGGAFQQWVRLTDGTQALKNPATGKCLDTHGGTNGSTVWLWTCNGGVAQRWLRQPDGTLKNPDSGRCLDISSYNLNNSGTPNLWDCTGRWNQIWMPTDRSELMLTQNVRCATAASTTENAQIQNQPCGTVDNNPGDVWQPQRDGSVKNPNSGKCLDVLNSGTANGTVVQLHTCNQTTAQQWTAQADGTLKNPNSGKCLDAGGNAIHAQQLTIQTCTTALSQQWTGRTQDHRALNGQTRTEYALNNGAVDHASVHRYTITPTASRAAYTTPAATVYADMVRENQTKTSTWIAATSSWRWTQQDTTFDGYGMPSDVNSWGDVASSTDDVCTHTDYAYNTSAYLLSFPKQSTTTDCATGPHDGNYLAGTQVLYDGGAAGTPPSQGLPTQTNALTAVTGTALSWTKQGRSTYDQYGRPQDSFDALEHKSMIRYTPATGGPVTATTVTNPLGHVQTTTVEPGHGTTTTMLDANNQTTTAQYDALGRLTKAWAPGRPTTATPDAQYAYALSSTTPSTVTAKTLNPAGNQVTSVLLYDGWLRQRQTQTPAAQANGGRIVTDAQYDARGLARQQTTFWDATTAPATTLAGFSNADVQQQTRTTFDALERPTATGLYSADALRWQTTAAYDGNSTTVVPPSGGTPSKTTYDVFGQTVELRQYTTGSVGGASQATTYSYDHLGQLTKVTDAAGNQWTTTYDRLGQITATTDPDAGASSYTFDAAGRMTSSVDGRSIKLAYAYDDLDRLIGVYNSTTTGFKRADWVYDTIRKGALTKSTRYVDADSYTSQIDSYDAQGRPLSVTTTLPLTSTVPGGSYTVSSTYNVDGSPASTTYPAAGGLPQETVTYSYDTTGRTLGMSGLDTYVADTSYYGWGPAYQQVLGSGTKKIRNTATIEQASGRLTGTLVESQNQTVTTNWDERLKQTYTYDNAGNITSAKETSASSIVANECFQYDGLRELTEAWTTTATTCQTTPAQTAIGGADPYWTSYRYQQSTGNRTTETKHAATGDTTRTYVYPASGTSSVRPHAITRVDSTGAATGSDTYTYTASGGTQTRTIAAGTNQTLAWDNEGLLKTITEAAGTSSYIYDSDGNQLVATDPQGTTVFLPGFDLRVQSGTTTATRYYGGVAARTTSGGLTWLATDPHGTGSIAINANSLTSIRRRVDPYGNPRTTGITWPTNRGFVGGVEHTTGLVHLGARDYEPSTGRFTSTDPIFSPDDPLATGGYAYADNNPTTLSDPSGLKSIFDGGGGGGMVGGAVGPGSGNLVRNTVYGMSQWACGLTGFACNGWVPRTAEDEIYSAGRDSEVAAARQAREIEATSERALTEARHDSEALHETWRGGAQAGESHTTSTGGARPARSGSTSGKASTTNTSGASRVTLAETGKRGGTSTGDSLPGPKGAQVPGRLSPNEMAALSTEHGVEFALVYRAGSGKAGGGGTYWLYSGGARGVMVPVGQNSRVIYHTHPGGTRKASEADMNMLKDSRANGSPQMSSQIVLPDGSTMRYGGLWSDYGNHMCCQIDGDGGHGI